MDTLQQGFLITDWIWLGLFALVPILIAWGIYIVRAEIRELARLKATPIRLKTTDVQRRRWRLNKQCHSRDLLNLLDDVDALLQRLEERDVDHRHHLFVGRPINS